MQHGVAKATIFPEANPPTTQLTQIPTHTMSSHSNCNCTLQPHAPYLCTLPSPPPTPPQAREPMLAGLVECLRLTPPRCPPEQPPDLSRRMWSIAKAYWMQAGATTAAAAAQQARLAGALAALKGGQGGVGPTGVKGGPALGSLLVQLQSQGGGSVSKQQLAAAQALVAAGGEDQLRCTAVVSALWGMASIGGPLFFQQELDALCQVRNWLMMNAQECTCTARAWCENFPCFCCALSR
jgi:hypothetical protein